MICSRELILLKCNINMSEIPRQNPLELPTYTLKNERQEGKTGSVRGRYQWERGGHKEWVKEGEYENRTMKPVTIVQIRGKVG
jgi:hypothetical protein